MGYTSIDELKKIYDLDEFKNFRKGIKGPLCKYFEGTVRIEKMSREEATKWKKTIDNLINSIAVEIADIKYNIAGSYARKKELIGDIDYVIVINDNDKLFEVLNEILDKLTRLTRIQNLSVSLDSVVETPSKPTKSRYTTGIKAWFNMPDGKKTKIEIYGYSMDLEDFCFAYYARAADVDLQKKIKYFASRKGYKLSPFGLFDKKTDNSIYKIPEQLEILQEKLNKEKITSIKDLYKFLDYNHS
jgi:DNA polymerase/3'-5' exonuclease PolX